MSSTERAAEARQRAVIAAPYWRQPGHLGCRRVDRIIRWMAAGGTSVTVVRAGSSDRVETTEWGVEVTVRDPIGFYADLPADTPAIPLRPKSRLRRIAAYLLLVPDPFAPWARRAARHPLALENAWDAVWVLSSSPPESAHLAAEGLARSIGGPLVLDLRDGWLDEPMIPTLSSGVQRYRHSRLERRLMRRADRIFVTSGHWRRMLEDRSSAARGKIEVLTNAYPEPPAVIDTAGDRPPDAPLTLLYAGKVFSSRSERRLGHLFDVLEAGLAGSGAGGRLVFVGNLDADERRQLDLWDERLIGLGWRVESLEPVPHDRALQLMKDADGLLLLSASQASIPAKLFDYAWSGRPILAVAPVDSAVWELGGELDRMVLVAVGELRPGAAVERFLELCRSRSAGFELPERFSETFIRDRFLATMPR
jgi:hypothetical protein